MLTTQRTWAEVHLDRIAHNYHTLRQALPEGCRFLAPVKCNAYGHGAIPVARLMADLGCEYLSVACLSEALALRQAGLTSPILIFGYTPPDQAQILAENRLSQTVFDLESAQGYSHALRGTGKSLTIHLKLDSGMGRLGFPCHTGADLSDILSVLDLPHLYAEGVFTHFSVADTLDDLYTQGQQRQFIEAVQTLESHMGRPFPIRHMANSGATLRHPGTHANMIRPGIALYGHSPNPEVVQGDLLPAMELRTRIIQLKSFDAGQSISYGRTYETYAGQRIAVLPVGYGDGLHRCLSGRMDMLLHGQRIKQVGRICMDLTMVDVTKIHQVSTGDVVTVFGQDGDTLLPLEEHSALAGTICYELLCAVATRVPRLYLS